MSLGFDCIISQVPGQCLSRKVYQSVCVLLSFLVLRVSLGFDCIISQVPGQCVSRKVYQFVCVLLSLFVLRVGLGLDCISSWSTPIFLLKKSEIFIALPLPSTETDDRITFF